jgi:tetratricopeptide (TPR) repeat protein
LKWSDRLLAALVLIFAFLAASFPARNSDFWLHLATGRLLAQGEYSFGTDPFAYTTSGIYWANHSWLFDLGLYAGHQSLGDAMLVVLKALAILILACLMLRAARNYGPYWISAGCILLAILAMQPRLLLQPTCASLVLLALSLVLLQTGGRALYFVPSVIVLWVNLDSWFLLGPLIVALYAFGQWISPRHKGAQHVPLWLVPACLVACFVSPHHFHALTLPAELSPAVWQSELSRDVRFAAIFASPWQSAPWERGHYFNWSAWAFFLLLGLGMISFLANSVAIRSWRFPVWASFAVLGAWQARLIPFFAVVAGPITALNLGDFVSAPTRANGFATSSRCCRLVSWSPRLLVWLSCFFFIALTWPGWLQGFERRDRPLAWDVPPDPSLQRVAQTLTRWRESRSLSPELRTFAAHPDVAHYLAWFCPGEKVFLDSRFALFVGVASDYERVCQALDLVKEEGAHRRPQISLDDVLDRHGIGCILLYDSEFERLAGSLGTAIATGWGLLSIDGQTVVFGRGKMVAPALGLDFERAAFAVTEDDRFPVAPDRGTVLRDSARRWWQRYLEQSSGSSWDGYAAAVYLQLFEYGFGRQQIEPMRLLAHWSSELMGLPTCSGGSAAPAAIVAFRLAARSALISELEERPPALPLLAVRAARRAVDAHADDAGAWRTLARAYLSLDRETVEGEFAVRLSPLAQIRRIQTVTALVQATYLRPNLAEAHGALARIFADSGYLDLAVRHGEIHVQLVQDAGRRPNEEPSAFASRMERLRTPIERLRRMVQDNENRFLVRTHRLAADPLARARTAVELGLPGKAIDEVLLRAHADLYGVDGLQLLLQLLLATGRAAEARELLDRSELRQNPDGLGVTDVFGGRDGGRLWNYRFFAYDWFDLCQVCAAGNYEGASNTLERIRSRMKYEQDVVFDRIPRLLVAKLGAEIGVGAMPAQFILHFHARPAREEMAAVLTKGQFFIGERADLHVIEAMLMLEQGRPAPARDHLRRAAELYKSVQDSSWILPGRPLAQYYLEWLQNRGSR